MRQYDHEQKSAIVASLAGGVSHDVSNRVGAIAGLATLIRMKSTDANVKESAGEMISACRSAGDMAKALLNIIRNDKRSGETTVNAHEIIDTAAELLESGLGRRITLKRELNAKRCFVLADPTQFQCAILDAGLKAANIAAGGEAILITTDNITENDGVHIRITVSRGKSSETMSSPVCEKS